MTLFHNVVNALRTWLHSIPFIKSLMPYATHIMFGSLGIYVLLILMGSFMSRFYQFYSLLSILCYQGFLLGFWLVLISPNKKMAPYGLFIKALITLYPLSSIYLSKFINAGIYVFFGYWLMKYVNMYFEQDKTFVE